jgi:phosphoglycerate kinase
LDTINFLTERRAKVILIAHLESVDGDNPSLEPVSISLNKFGIKTIFSKLENAYEIIENKLENGQCLLIENLRLFDGEKKNDKSFAKQLASLGDIFVNDAFSVCHREHASIVGIPKYIDSYAGIQLEKEVSNLSRAFEPDHPFLFILGGAKFETKLPLIEKFSNLADNIFIGGALANDILKARGYPVGVSKVSPFSKDIENTAKNHKVIIPNDVIVEGHIEKNIESVSNEDKIFDAGNKTLDNISKIISNSKFVLWNGPLGLYEDGYQGATLELAKIIAKKTEEDKNFVSIVGGGDTVAGISSLGIQEKFTFISTGGGAMLDFLAKGTLPGIEVLK